LDKIFLLLVLMMFMIAALFVASMPPSESATLSPVPALEGAVPDKPWFRKAVLDAPGTVVVLFTAPHCGYCREMEPRLKALVKEHADRMSLVTVDSKTDPELSEYYQAIYVPYLMVFVNGKPVGTVQGQAPMEAIEEMVRPYVNGKPANAA
jgi:thioredoxin-like negative regulator of GroEL